MADERDLTTFPPLFPDFTEERLRIDFDAWANEGTDPDDPTWTDTREGGFFQMCTEGGVRNSAREYDLMGTETVAASTPLWAWGEYLDDHAEVKNVFRLAATFADAEITFTGDPGTAIPAGIRVAVEPSEPEADSIEFEIDIGGNIGGGGEVTLAAQAVTAGTAGNVPAGSIEVEVSALPDGVVSFTNESAAIGGTDPETDDALRSRLLDAYEGRGPGVGRDYREWARAYGGVGHVTVIPLWNGPGTVKVIVTSPEGGPVGPSIVEGLQAFLDPVAGLGEGEAPIGAHVTVGTADEMAVTVAADVEFEPGYSLDGTAATIALRAPMQEAVNTYIQTIDSGGEIVLAQVAARLVGILGVHDLSNLLVNGVAANVPVSVDPPMVPSLTLPLDLTEVA